MADATGETDKPLRVAFDRRIKLQFHGAHITSDGGLLVYRELDDAFSLTAMGALGEGRCRRNIRHRGHCRMLTRSAGRVMLVTMKPTRGYSSPAEQWIREGKYALRWTRLSCHSFRHNAVRLQLHALAYNLANFLRSLALPRRLSSGRSRPCARSWSRSAPGSCATGGTWPSSSPRWRCRERSSPRSCAGSTAYEDRPW